MDKGFLFGVMEIYSKMDYGMIVQLLSLLKPTKWYISNGEILLNI